MLLDFLGHRFKYVLDGWEHGPSDVLGCLHLEGLEVVAIPIPGHNATGQDALAGAAVVF
jgi:hypothetical protein